MLPNDLKIFIDVSTIDGVWNGGAGLLVLRRTVLVHWLLAATGDSSSFFHRKRAGVSKKLFGLRSAKFVMHLRLYVTVIN